MDNKICLRCNLEKLIEDFFNYPDLFDREFNYCKDCRISDSLNKQLEIKNNNEWQEKERKRHREKYYRLNYKEIHKPCKEVKREILNKHKLAYPEKYKAKIKSQRLPRKKGNHLHHWSYNEEHWKDVIELSVQDHNFLHRHIIYDNEKFMYRKKSDRQLLETKQSHVELLKSLTILNTAII